MPLALARGLSFLEKHLEIIYNIVCHSKILLVINNKIFLYYYIRFVFFRILFPNTTLTHHVILTSTLYI